MLLPQGKQIGSYHTDQQPCPQGTIPQHQNWTDRWEQPVLPLVWWPPDTQPWRTGLDYTPPWVYMESTFRGASRWGSGQLRTISSLRALTLFTKTLFPLRCIALRHSTREYFAMNKAFCRWLLYPFGMLTPWFLTESLMAFQMWFASEQCIFYQKLL